MDQVKCRNCGLHSGNKSNCIGGEGSENPLFFLIGEAPGEQEDIEGRPFVGRAGILLRRKLDFFNFSAQDYYITNTCKCHPPGNRNPSKGEMNACIGYLFREIQKYKPKVLVTLGEIATAAILGKEGIGLLRGRFHWSDTYECWVFPTYHPAAVLRTPTRGKTVDEDFTTLKKFLEEQNFQREEPKNQKFGEWHLVSTPDELSQLVKKVSKAGLTFFDLETNGLDMFLPTMEIRSVSYCFQRKIAYVIPFGILEGTRRDAALATIKFIQENPAIKKAAQNMNFDVKTLKVRYGIDTNNWWFDTMLGHALLSPIRGIHNQHWMINEYIGKTRLDISARGYDERVREIGGAHKLPLGNDLWEYNAMDSMTGFEIMEFIDAELNKSGQSRLFREVVMEVADDLTDMEIKGMRFDVDYITKLDAEYAKDMARLSILMETDPGVIEYERRYGKQFNPRSSDDVVWLLFSFYQLAPVKMTKTGRPSVNKETLAALSSKNKYCRHATEFRRLDKARSTYLSGLAAKLYDSISHTTFNLSVTRSGRTSSGLDKDSKYGGIEIHAFNMQNIPRDKSIRRIMVAREGHILVAGDLSQAELRVMAAISKDEALKRAVMSGDVHRAMAATLFNIPFESITKEQRMIGKTTSFAIIYGIGPEALAEDFTIATGNNWSVGDAADIVDIISKRFPGISAWKKYVEWHIKKHGFIESPLGRRRFFEIKDEKEIRESINSPIQATASDFTLIGIIQVNRLLKQRGINGYLVSEVHDQIIGEARDNGERRMLKMKDGGEIEVSEDAYQLALAIKEGMVDVKWPNSGEPFDWMSVPLVVDVSVGGNMGEMVEVEI